MQSLSCLESIPATDVYQGWIRAGEDRELVVGRNGWQEREGGLGPGAGRMRIGWLGRDGWWKMGGEGMVA